MKKYFATIILVFSTFTITHAQTRGVKIGYIDMEYILQNVNDYAEAKSQLEQKAEKWKQDIEAKKVEIAKLKDALKTERALLTKELISEREEEIKFQEDELIDFQQKKFGPNGDLITQKAVLVKPIQDQVFTAAQDIAELKKLDFVFDKSSDLTILFAAKRFDISDQVLRTINRAEKREQMSNKQLKALEAKEFQEDTEDANPELAARRQALEEKKLAREKLIEERKQAAEAKRLEKEEKRQQLLEEKNAKKNGTVPASSTPVINKTESTTDKKVIETNVPVEKQTVTPAATTNKTVNNTTTEKSSSEKIETKEPGSEAVKETTSAEDKAAARAKLTEDRKKELEEKRKKALEEKNTLKNSAAPASQNSNKPANNVSPKATDTDKPTTKEVTPSETTNKSVKTTEPEKNSSEKVETKEPSSETVKETTPAEDKAAARAKLIEDRKKELEEKRKKILEEREAAKEAAKKAREEKANTQKPE